MLKILPILLLTSCAHTWDCIEYGIKPGSPNTLKTINELPDAEIKTICGAGAFGCVKDGNVYYRTGDECALRHELCHVMHGPYHTVEYHQKLIANRGTCP